ncbi:MAG: adenylate/guanylate cyclase domain-containing protein [Planctomycetaceae bacterium]
MLELLANGPINGQRISYPLEAGATYVLGRDTAADLPVPWDLQISRRHAKIRVAEDAVEVERLDEARNPVFFDGAQRETARVAEGRHFVVGETVFLVFRRQSPTTITATSGEPIREVLFDRTELDKVRFHDADKRIDVLANLPEVIAGARTEGELFDRLGKLILAGVSHADATAILVVPADGPPHVGHWERRREAAGEFRPSKRLIADAVLNKRRTVLHMWDAQSRKSEDYTQVAEFDWAFCTPVSVPTGESWGLYVTGRLDLPLLDGQAGGGRGHNLDADVKFTELVAEIISAVRRVNVLERERAGFRQFFAPAVLSALEDNPELLEPRESDVTVLFCDLRGFSQKAEAAGSNLLGLLNRVSSALEIMTEHILNFGGVTADFMGDAALGFWGWPISSKEAPLNACRAALGIRAAFDAIRADADHPLANFSMGIGIAHGPAVAGKIGTRDQVKVSVFGPVVNLASRLEGMTKLFRVPIVMDDATAELAREYLSPEDGRVRRLGTVPPYGRATLVSVSELVPPLVRCPDLTDTLLAVYERGVEHFEKGEWEEAYRCFHKMPENDRAQDFPGIRIAQHNRVAPPDWNGVVRLGSK